MKYYIWLIKFKLSNIPLDSLLFLEKHTPTLIHGSYYHSLKFLNLL